MVKIKRINPAPVATGRYKSRLRIPSRACHRCRSLHKKCDIHSKGQVCSNCDVAGVSCRGGGNSELRIRFSELSHQPQVGRINHLSSPSAKSQHRPSNEGGSIKLRNDGHVPDQAITSLSNGDGANLRSGGQDNRDSTSLMQPSLQPFSTVEPDTWLPEIAARGSESSRSRYLPARRCSNLSSPEALLESGPPDLMSVGGEAALGSNGAVPPDEVSQLDDSSTCVPRYNDAIKPRLRVDSSPWPLTDNEANLVKHFFAILMPWFDYCCASTPFRSYFRFAIRKDPGILYAMLAVSARHLEAVTSNNFNSNEYERRCLGILIPMLNNNDAAQSQDDAVLVSALLLRLLDEMTDPADSHSVIRHAVSAPLFLRMRQYDPRPSELSNAAMAIVLRQEIHVANMTKRPVELAGHDCGIDDSLGPASDIMWTCRMMSHAARVTNYAYGTEPRNQAVWDQLWGYLEEWTLQKPPSFRPLNQVDSTRSLDKSCAEDHVQSKEGEQIFPHIYYVHDCAIAGEQYVEICKIILLAHDPRTPALGSGRTNLIRAQEERIRRAVRKVCGIWLSNPEYAPARVLAALALAMTGELFTDPRETVQLLDIVSEAEMHVGWPCLKVSPHLRKFWSLDNT